MAERRVVMLPGADNRFAGVGEYGQGVARWLTMIDPEGNEFDVAAEGTLIQPKDAC